mmetsp:Transcript_22074/g.61131  ORF Transcript_22074/g.61131 Transcript_22074/m.61131 type:complete len:289 (-) Transcript_22074:55-921(-)
MPFCLPSDLQLQSLPLQHSSCVLLLALLIFVVHDHACWGLSLVHASHARCSCALLSRPLHFTTICLMLLLLLLLVMLMKASLGLLTCPCPGPKAPNLLGCELPAKVVPYRGVQHPAAGVPHYQVAAPRQCAVHNVAFHADTTQLHQLKALLHGQQPVAGRRLCTRASTSSQSIPGHCILISLLLHKQQQVCPVNQEHRFFYVQVPAAVVPKTHGLACFFAHKHHLGSPYRWPPNGGRQVMSCFGGLQDGGQLLQLLHQLRLLSWGTSGWRLLHIVKKLLLGAPPPKDG